MMCCSCSLQFAVQRRTSHVVVYDYNAKERCPDNGSEDLLQRCLNENGVGRGFNFTDTDVVIDRCKCKSLLCKVKV